MPVCWVSEEEVYHWRQAAIEAAQIASVSPAELDWLLQQVAGVDSLTLRLLSPQQKHQLPLKKSLSDLSQLWQKRLRQKVPVQYLAAVTPWRQFLLKVSPHVLIPRPETELVIDIVQKYLSPQQSEGHWVDLGTGSGAIAIGLADLLPKATIHAVDRSESAMMIAQENAINQGFKHRIKFYVGDWWTPLKHLENQAAAMVSNPPYIPTSLLSKLQPEVINHEPHIALDGGLDGLGAISHLAQTAPDYLQSGGLWLVEMMATQGEKVAKLLQDQGSYEKIEIIPDLAGFDRFVLAFKK